MFLYKMFLKYLLLHNINFNDIKGTSDFYLSLPNNLNDFDPVEGIWLISSNKVLFRPKPVIW